MDTTHTCALCGEEKNFGLFIRALDGSYVCRACWDQIERRPPRTVGKEFAEGIRAMRKYRRERGTAEVPYTRHTASEALSEVEREQAERLRDLEAGRNPHAPPEKTIEELLAESGNSP